ncbi:MAG TPA: PepSY-associated TM helix domain-containing protein, partial [Lacunisphaera sp.]
MAAPTAQAPAISPALRLRRWHAWLVVWRIHRWLGLGFGALLVLLSASGSLLVVHHELEHWLEPELRVGVPAAGAVRPALADLARTVSDLAPKGYRPFRILPANRENAAHQFLFRAADSTARWSVFVEPATGRVLWSGPDQALLTPWLLGFHMQLQAGRNGYYVTGLAGIGLVLLALTGLYIHRERLTQLWRHPFRLHLGWRVAFADLHKWIGIFGLYFQLILGVTGTLYVLSGLKATSAAPPTIVAPFDVSRLAPLEPMFAVAREKLPDAEVIRAQLPAQTGGAIVVLLLHREAPPWQKFSRVEFDAYTGALRTVRAAATAPAGDQFASMLAPLHFGFYGAAWVKWAYFIGGLSPALL